jgi:hypothetical protein
LRKATKIAAFRRAKPNGAPGRPSIINKETHGGKKSGSGRSTKEDHSPSRKAGPLGRGRRGQASGFGTFAVGQEGRPNQKTQRLNRYRESAMSVEAV